MPFPPIGSRAELLLIVIPFVMAVVALVAFANHRDSRPLPTAVYAPMGGPR